MISLLSPRAHSVQANRSGPARSVMEDRLQPQIKATHEIQYPNADRPAMMQCPPSFWPQAPLNRLLWAAFLCSLCAMPLQVQAQNEEAVFAVVSEAPKDKARVSAKALIDGAVSDIALVPNDTVLGNPIWRTLEICHAMKLEGSKATDGFKVSSVRILDASMLPMTLQGFAGDCLIKKAVDIAPLVD